VTTHPRYTPVLLSDATGELRETYDDIMQTMGVPFVLNWFTCQGGNPLLLRGNWSKVKHTLFSGSIPMLLKQLILHNVSSIRGCEYCTFIHGTTADSMGSELTDEVGFAPTRNLDSPHVPSAFRVAVEVVSRCALAPLSTTDADFERLREAGFSETEILELMAQADLVNLLNTIADVSGISIDVELLGPGL
jgi:AhpD family alkylhydroperoxidase